jgi:cell division protein FtsN
MAVARTKITSRDYKHAKPNSLSLDRVHWRDFGVGLAIGVALAAIVHVYHLGAPERERLAVSAEPRPAASKPAATDALEVSAEEDTAQAYDFYEMLPNFEVVVPEKDKEVRTERDNTLGPIERPGIYVLQAGSYRSVTEADRIRAQLKVRGIDAIVQRVAVDAEEWHRVRIGPISDLAELNRLRGKLRAADLDALVIRVGE